ncbi:hypothetical protein Agub_g11085 [Astrephomene gubernaculifera]|uniref:Tyrosine specific protein phosphatases domain-containing protein n=1 Tax=Astrephomene gubernaculifera TaxID=47775 RepID=A0AAD3DXU8_9CHLO|nr:hypothetical protein Agub_g11085 [Astrephomene gubernaculifera]
MSCKADAKYNFAKASEHDELVFGSARPGAPQQRCYNPEDKVTPAEVDDWAAFMTSHGVQRVVSLLSDKELDTYEQPLSTSLSRSFKRAINVDTKAPGGADTLLKELQDAMQAQEKVVVHCWGGGGRSGLALAAWLVRQHGLTPEQAAQHVMEFSRSQGASRRADVEQLKEFLATATAAPSSL